MVEMFSRFFAGRQKKQQTSTPSEAVTELVSVTPDVPEFPPQPKLEKNEQIENEAPFDENHQKTLEIHQDELPAFKEPVDVAIVSRAYKELFNGNLTEQLRSFSRIDQSKATSEMIIVVNNPRMYALIAELTANEALNLSQLEAAIREFYTKNQWVVSDHEEDYLRNLRSGRLKPDRVSAAYQENQLTLQILKVLSEVVIAVKEGKVSAADVEAAMEQKLRGLLGDLMSEDMTQQLVAESRHVIQTQSLILGIDCSSKDKAFSRTDLGQATNQGCHIAYERGAKYLDIGDMDQFRQKDAFDEIGDLLHSSDVPDYLYRPIERVAPQHPEQLNTSSWAELVNFYRSSELSRKDDWMLHFDKENRDKLPTSGMLLVSADTFAKVQYTHGSGFEDIGFAARVHSEPGLKGQDLQRSQLLLADRGREESFDGGAYESRTLQLDEVARDIEQRICYWAKFDVIQCNHIMKMLDDQTISVELQQKLQKMKQEFYTYLRHYTMLENSRRRTNRLMFLGDDGLVAKIFPFIQEPQLGQLDAATLTVEQRVFLEHNPALLPALKHEYAMKKFANLPDFLSYVENSLPELFATRQSADTIEQFLQDMDGKDQEEIAEAVKTNHLVNKSYWMPLLKSKQLLGSHLLKLKETGYQSNADQQLLGKLADVALAKW